MGGVDLSTYNAFFFDCDGVILNSNKVKTTAFYNAAMPYGRDLALQLVDYHIKNGGVSRYIKFNKFLTDMVSKNVSGPNLEELLATYAAEVHQGLMGCEIAGGLLNLREKTATADWFVVSGGDQQELREVFKVRGLAAFFNGGIYGSPATKDEILHKLLNSVTEGLSGVFLGDSKYDYLAASKANLDFVFVSGWSEFVGRGNYFEDKDISYINTLNELV